MPRGFVLLGVLLAASCAGAPARRVDLLVRGGTIVDGSGGPARTGDVAIDDGRIVAVGSLDGLAAERTIDASGRVVAPGFVDLHSHADLIVLGDRRLQERLLAAKISQGVTTIVVGNCGLGVAPSDEATAAQLAAVNGWMTPDGISAGALSLRGYLERLEAPGVALNVATLVPHGPVRIAASGLSAGEPTPEQLERMRRSLARALDDGAFGLSIGLIYPPGMYSSTDELTALARVVGQRGKLLTAHVRGSSETLIEATRELIEIGRESGARVHHSHLEAVGERFWPDIARVLALEDEARARSVRISHDVFPYTRAATMMSAIFPPWALEGGVESLLSRLADPTDRSRLREEIEQRVPEWPPWRPGGWPHNLVEAVGWDGILVASVGPGGPSDLVGRSLADAAEARGQDPFDLVADLMLSQQGQVGQLVGAISGDDSRLDALLSILVHPAAAVISDAEDYGRGAPHPAHAGAFARALRLARERGLLPLEEVVRRMTGYPASILGLVDRGGLAPGLAADLVVFDPEAIADRADWDDPRARAAGIDWVLINGAVAVESGRYAGGLHGRVLRAATSP